MVMVLLEKNQSLFSFLCHVVFCVCAMKGLTRVEIDTVVSCSRVI